MFGPPSYSLRDVFGVHIPPPEQTYVDRAGLDSRIQYFLSTGRHLVIHGPSKQGKTALRQRALPDDRCVVVQCKSRPNIEQLYSSILYRLGVSQTISKEQTTGGEFKAAGEAGGKAGIPLIARAEGKGSIEGSMSHERSSTTQPIAESPDNLHFLVEHVKRSGRRIVIEDFHYIPETVKRDLAKDLKALLELGVPVVLVGAWEQDELLPQYNGDLTGRIGEINVKWDNKELREVLAKGEDALNIRFSKTIKDAIISDASGNVGLLQRIAEKLCIHAGCLKTVEGSRNLIRSIPMLDAARKEICKEEAARYRAFGWSVSKGFRKSNEKTRSLYMYIIRTCVEAKDAELLAGLTQGLIEERIRHMDNSVSGSSIRKALSQIDKLQSDKSISPIIATFDPVNHTLNLADRELLFYRKYGGPRWPWEDSDE